MQCGSFPPSDEVSSKKDGEEYCLPCGRSFCLGKELERYKFVVASNMLLRPTKDMVIEIAKKKKE
jgi:hypothetical protein